MGGVGVCQGFCPVIVRNFCGVFAAHSWNIFCSAVFLQFSLALYFPSFIFRLCAR